MSTAYDFSNYQPKVKRCTIITDASWCPNTGAAGFSAWCAGFNGSGRVGGALKDRMSSSTTSEIAGSLNGLHGALQKGYVAYGFEVLMQIDNLDALEVLSFKRKPKNNVERKAVATLKDWIKRYNLKVTYKHIRSHSTEEKSRNFAHNKCDMEAKAFMRSKRTQYRVQDLRKAHGLAGKASSKVSPAFLEANRIERKLMQKRYQQDGI